MRLLRSGRLAGQELLEADGHLAVCEECQQALLQGAGQSPLETLAAAGWELRGGEHLSYEQLRDYATGAGPVEQRSLAEAHVNACASCRGEVRDLRAFTRDSKRPSRIWVGISAAAACVAAILFLWARTSSPPALTVSLRDANSTIGIDARGQFTGPASLPPEVRKELANVLQRQALEAGIDPELHSETSVLLGPDGAGQTEFRVLAPVGRAVLSVQPEFRWSALSGARSYRVELFDTSYRLVVSSSEITGTTWTPPSPLDRGKVYGWQVTAKLEKGVAKAPHPPSGEARFEVISKEAASSIEQARLMEPVSHLLLAARYASAGLCGEALQELDLLAVQNTGSGLANRLRNDLSRHCLSQ